MEPAPAKSYTNINAMNARQLRLVLIGKKHINGPTFSETYDMDIVEVKPEAFLEDVIFEALGAAEKKTEIPVNLLQAFQLVFIP